MAINLSNQGGTPTPVADTTAVETQMEVIPYDINTDKEQVALALKGSQEIEDLTAQIDITDLTSIVSFGSVVAEELSKASDTVLNSMSLEKINESSKMLNVLAGIMSKFDIDEIKEEDENFFKKMFNNAKKNLEKILDKYQTMGGEVDKIYVTLKQYENEIKQSNKHLDVIFENNVAFYHELIKYIVAGEKGVEEIDAYLTQRRADLASTGDQSIQFEITNLEQASMMLAQRTHDLRIAENVAMQSIPMIKTMQFSNMNLVRKINSAFIITLPVFKQALAQAIMLKRQKVQAEAMAALDEKTNEMLIRNAQNTVNQSKLTAQLASGSSVKIETLEQTWRTITQGIAETQAIQDEAARKRQEDKVRLDAIKKEFEDNKAISAQKLLK